MNNPYQAPSAPFTPHAYAPADAGGTPLGVTEGTVRLLQQTRPWVTLMSVLLFLASLFMVGAGLVMLLGGLATAFASRGGGPSSLMRLFGLLYLPMGALYFYPALKLWMYGSAIGRLVFTGSATDLEAALAQQKHFWKFAGIATIALLVVWVGLVVVGISIALGR